jgi:pyruvate dehydrogenase E1 component alpha subunit
VTVPRTDLEVPFRLERLGILAEDGSVDEELLPELDADLLRRMYRTMLLSRRLDERLLTLQKQGRIGTFAPAIGQEAAQIGATSALDGSDWMVPSYRESAAALWRGTPLWGLMLYDAGWNEGAAVPEGQKDLPIAVPVASQIPHAVGLAHAAKLRGSDEVVMVHFGDGATSEGDFHEAMNFAGVHDDPVVFCCQNNQYAISTPLELQTAAEAIAQKAVAYGLPGIQVDGNDVFAVHVAASEAVQRARDGDGPTLVEAVTYRLSVHTTADDPSTYREDAEVEQWRERDPIPRLRRHLVDRDVLSEDDTDRYEEEIDREIDDAWNEAERRMDELDDPAAMFDHVHAEAPPDLREQREEFTGEQRGDSDA